MVALNSREISLRAVVLLPSYRTSCTLRPSRNTNTHTHTFIPFVFRSALNKCVCFALSLSLSLATFPSLSHYMRVHISFVYACVFSSLIFFTCWHLIFSFVRSYLDLLRITMLCVRILTLWILVCMDNLALLLLYHSATATVVIVKCIRVFFSPAFFCFFPFYFQHQILLPFYDSSLNKSFK